MANFCKSKLEEYSSFLNDDDDEKDSEIEIRVCLGNWQPSTTVDTKKQKQRLNLSLSSQSDSENKNYVKSEKILSSNNSSLISLDGVDKGIKIHKNTSNKENELHTNLTNNNKKSKMKPSTVGNLCDLNSDLDFFNMICTDTKNNSQIHVENNSSLKDYSNKTTFSQKQSEKVISLPLEPSSAKQIIKKRISTEFNDSFNIIADDFENDIFKGVLEVNNTNKRTIKNSESPNLFSTSSSESLLKRSQLQNSENFNIFVSPILNKCNRKPSPKCMQKNCVSQYSQFLKSTQVQKQLDEVISHGDDVIRKHRESLDILKENNKINSLSNTWQDLESPIISTNGGKRKSIESLSNDAKIQKTNVTSLNDIQNKENKSQFNCSKFTIPKNFRNNDIDLNSTQYRQGITQLFERMEKSICQFGPNCDDKENNVQTSKNVTGTDWPDDSFMANLSLEGLIEQTESGSINDFIKKALRENAGKAVQPQNLVNRTIVNTGAIFRQLGTFYGLPDKVMELIKLYKGIDKLYDWQDECLKLPAVKQRKNLIYSLPTSGGKTLVAEILILREIICRKRNVIFVLPYVAIVQEKVWALSPFAVALDFLIEEYAAGKGNYPPRKRRYKNSVYIATTEKAVGLINSLIEQGRLEELGLIVVDELHLIGDMTRGGTLEALLTKLMCLNEDIQIVGMSATIGNLSDLQQFLKADVYTRNFRPVELTEYVKCGNEIAKVNSNNDDDNIFEVIRKVDFSYSETVARMDPDRLGGLVMEVIPKGSCLIFCSTKNSCENVTRLLAKILLPKLKDYRKKEKQQLLNTLKNETGTLCSILEYSIPFGIAYHHSGLTTDERKLIEEAYRSEIICVICCTSTLAAGVNLPAKRVIIRKPYIAREFISLSRYKQMSGRAGRAGFGEVGESILICEKQDLVKVRKLFLSPMDQTLSRIHSDNGNPLRHLFLSCISLKTANTKTQLEKIANSTLLAVQQQKLNVDIKILTKQAISKLFKYGAVQVFNDKNIKSNSASSICDVSVHMNSSSNSISSITSGHKLNSGTSRKKNILLGNDDKLVVSKLGNAAIKGCLELSKAHLLYEDLKKAQESLVLVDCLHLLYLVTPYSVAEQTKLEKNHSFNILSRLGDKERKTAAILGITNACIMRLYSNQNIKSIDERVLNRFYLALMLYDLWNEVSVIEVSEKYQINRGIVQNLMTNSASFASNVVHFCEELEEFWAFAYLLKGMNQRLEHCCCRELLPLMELPAVKQGRARQLYNVGFKTLQSIAKADPNELIEAIEFMTRRLANQLIAAAKLLLLEKVETLREEAEDVLDGVENPKMLLNHSFFMK